jgi:serine palmitoyltransferase
LLFYRLTGKETECLNLGSYNYLGFAQSSGPCAEDSGEAIKSHGCGICSPRQELGNN